MGKQQNVPKSGLSTLEILDAKIAKMEAQQNGTVVETVESTPTPDASQSDRDKIDNMSNDELLQYIDTLPGGKTKSDKPLPDRASSGRPVQKWEAGSLALGGLELSEGNKQKVITQAQLAMGDNSSIVSDYKTVMGGGKTIADFQDQKDPKKAYKKYQDDNENALDYIASFVNPAGIQQMSAYAGNEELSESFKSAYSLTQELTNDLKQARKLQTELAPYFKEEGNLQVETQAEADMLNAKQKELTTLRNRIASKTNQTKNEKGEVIESQMLQSIADIKKQNTWSYGNAGGSEQRFGFNEDGGIVTNKTWRKNSENIMVAPGYKTDAAAREKTAAYKSITNLDAEFDGLYKTRVTPIYASFLDNAQRKLNSTNPDDQRYSFDLLMGALAGSEDIVPYAKRTIDRIKGGRDYDDQIDMLKNVMQTPGILKAMIKNTNNLRKSEFVLNYSKTNFGADKSNYPKTTVGEITSQNDWHTFATNGTLKQLDQDKKEWNGSATEIAKTMKQYIANDDDTKIIFNKFIEDVGVKDYLYDAGKDMIASNGQIVPFNKWMNGLIEQERVAGNADMLSRLFGAKAADWDYGLNDLGEYTVYVNTNTGDVAPKHVTDKAGYVPITIHPAIVKGLDDNLGGAHKGETYVSDYDNERRNTMKAYVTSRDAVKKAYSFWSMMGGRIKEEYNDLKITHANRSTLKLSGLGNYSSEGLTQFGIDARTIGNTGALANTKAFSKSGKDNEISLEDMDKMEISDIGYKNPKLNMTNKHKNIQDGIFSLIAPNGKFIDYNDDSYVDPMTSMTGPYSSHMTQNGKHVITVTNEWDNNAMGEGGKFSLQNAKNNKELLEGFFNQGEKESNADYEKRMGSIEMTARRIGMEKDKSTYEFTDGNDKSIYVNIPHSSLEATNESFYKYTGRSAGEKEFKVTGKELLAMPKTPNGDDAFQEPLYLQVNEEGMYVVPVKFEDENGVDFEMNVRTNLPEGGTSLPDARKLTRKLVQRLVDLKISPYNQ
tara:strand:- start:9593 stop:12592 length:3000 start_codon:yes stop_codon:yes gene_type:complete